MVEKSRSVKFIGERVSEKIFFPVSSIKLTFPCLIENFPIIIFGRATFSFCEVLAFSSEFKRSEKLNAPSLFLCKVRKGEFNVISETWILPKIILKGSTFTSSSLTPAKALPFPLL